MTQLKRHTAIVLWLVPAVILTLSLAHPRHASAQGSTCDVPSSDYPTIQSAVDDNNCDVIILVAASYLENVTISRSLAIRGQGAENTAVENQLLTPIFTIQGDPVVRFIDLTIEDGDTVDIGGAGIRIEGGSVRIRNSIIQNNDALGDVGGGIALYAGKLVIVNTTLFNNTAEDGNGGGIYVQEGTVTIIASTFSSNDSFFTFGAGIYNENGTVRIVASTFESNIADFGGGGVYNNNGTIIVRNSSFYNNEIFEGGPAGGAIRNASGTLRIFDSTFSGNAPDAIFNLSGNVGLAASTISFGTNPDAEYGLYTDLETGSFRVVNTIIAANENGSACGGFGVTSLGHNIATDSSCNLTAEGDQPNTDPLLGPLQDNGGPTWTHALQAGSPAIDAGNDAACTPRDQRGVRRPQDGDGDGVAVCDIGAYEQRP